MKRIHKIWIALALVTVIVFVGLIPQPAPARPRTNSEMTTNELVDVRFLFTLNDRGGVKNLDIDVSPTRIPLLLSPFGIGEGYYALLGPSAIPVGKVAWYQGVKAYTAWEAVTPIPDALVLVGKDVYRTDDFGNVFIQFSRLGTHNLTLILPTTERVYKEVQVYEGGVQDVTWLLLTLVNKVTGETVQQSALMTTQTAIQFTRVESGNYRLELAFLTTQVVTRITHNSVFLGG